jgi:DNA-binding NarL/FixJ family response regulator
MDVLRLLAQGLPNRKIGECLSINERTVKYHVAAILAKLEAANRTEAVMRAIERGLITV